MKKLILAVSLMLLSFCGFTTHLKGGWITYRQTGERMFTFTLYTLSDPSAMSNGTTVSVSVMMGDGNTETVSRESVTSISSNTQLNKYTFTHNYAADGNYKITYADPNFIGNVRNVNSGNTSSIPFIVSLDIKLSSSVHPIAGAFPLTFDEELDASSGLPFSYSPTFSNQTDSIAYELTNIHETHVYPPGMSINPYTGLILWEDLTMPAVSSGYYLVAYKVMTYRGSMLVSTQEVLQCILTAPLGTQYPETVTMTGTDYTQSNWYRKLVSTNNDIVQDLSFDLVTPGIYHAFVTGETAATVTGEQTSAQTFSCNLNIDFDTVSQRATPYFYTIRVTREGDPKYFKDYILAVYYGASPGTGLFGHHVSQIKARIYPNPATTAFRLSGDDLQSGTVAVEIFNVEGKLLRSANVTHGEAVETTGMDKGIYMVKMQQGDRIGYSKLVIE